MARRACRRIARAAKSSGTVMLGARPASGHRPPQPSPEAITMQLIDEVSASDLPSIEEAHARLYLAGWTVGDALALSPRGPVWVVSGHNGAYRMWAEGETLEVAWGLACQQAEVAGLID
jgi:hypothetical protein